MRPVTAITLLWLIWAISWGVAAFWAAPVKRRAGFQAEMPYRAVLLIGAILFFIPAHGYAGRLRLWIPDRVEAWICVALIYTGLLLAILATMAAKGTVWGIAGAILLTIGIVMKARLEERFLRSELGTAYDDYAGRIPMLVPFAPA